MGRKRFSVGQFFGRAVVFLAHRMTRSQAQLGARRPTPTNADQCCASVPDRCPVGARSSPATLALFLVGVLFHFVALPAFADDEPIASSAPAPVASKASDFGLPQVKLINDQVAQAWKEHKLVPAEAASDGEWCRRVYLDVIGRVPSVEELKAYLADKKRDKRARLVGSAVGR